MFRRKSTAEDAADSVKGAGAVDLAKTGKGRPTPTRKEAEAAARERARAPRNRKEEMQRQRKMRSEAGRKAREGMKAGDERYLLGRDKGPVRRFVRDFVDTRFGIAEVAMPLLLVALFVQQLVVPLFIVLVIDLLILRFRLRKQLRERFPDESHKGTTWYAVSRAMQMKFLRLPKPQVRIGQELPQRYR